MFELLSMSREWRAVAGIESAVYYTQWWHFLC